MQNRPQGNIRGQRIEKMEAYEDPKNEGNSSKYHTGKVCIECQERPAGTAWSPYWCYECNVERMKRITKQMEEIRNSMGKK